ncbi:MAG: hypothetical protein ABGY42_11245 [bacterium]
MKFLTLTLAAVMTLVFSFTTTPAGAAPIEEDRCKRLVTKAERNYASCVIGVVARNLRFGQQTGPQPTAVSACDNRRATALDRIGAKFPSLAPGDCGLDTASAAARATAALVLAGLEEPIDAAAAAQAACEDANGTWESGTCTAGSSYNCTIGAMCSAWAAAYPADTGLYTNNYKDHTAETTGCPIADWNYISGLIPYPLSYVYSLGFSIYACGD